MDSVLGSALLFGNRRVIIERAAALRLPAIYQWPEHGNEGGLIGYGPSFVRIYTTQLSRMAAEILRGTKPADIPVEQPTRFYLMGAYRSPQFILDNIFYRERPFGIPQPPFV